MADDATILAKFATAGGEEFLKMWDELLNKMTAAQGVTKALQQKLDELLSEGVITRHQHFVMVYEQMETVVKNVIAAERERKKVLDDLDRSQEKMIEEMSKEDAAIQKIRDKTAELNATALGRFNMSIYGGVEALEKMETNAYRASRNAAVLMRSFVQAPIQTMKQFAASTEKAAIASQFLREQLSFVLASRFGTIALGFAIFGSLAKAIRDTTSAAMELQKQVKLVESAFLGTERTLNTYSQIQNEILNGSMQFGQSYQDIAKILWELKSAGLATADAMQGLSVNQQLVVAGASNLEQSTRLTAGLMRTFGDEIEGTVNSQEKFRRIGEVLAAVVYDTQGSMNDLVSAFQYTASTADVAGIRLDVLAALIGIMNDKMLFGSKAGTSLNNALIQMAKNLDDVVERFGLIVDKSQPLGDQLLPIIEQMQNKFKGTSLTFEELADQFELFNIRGGRGWAAIITAGDRLNRLLNTTNAALSGTTDYLTQIANTKMDNLIDQWARLKAGIKATTQELVAVEQTKWFVKMIADSVELDRRMKQLATEASKLGTIRIEYGLKRGLVEVAGSTEKALEITRKYGEELAVFVSRLKPLQQIDDAVDSLEDLESQLKALQGLKLSISDKLIYQQLRNLGVQSEKIQEAFEKYPATVRVMFYTPGLKESIKDAEDFLKLIDAFADRPSVSILIPEADQQKWKRLGDDILAQKQQINMLDKKEKDTLTEKLVAIGAYNTILSLGLGTQNQVNSLIQKRINLLAEEIKSGKLTGDKLKEKTTEYDRLIAQQQSFNREITKTKGLIDKISIIEMSYRGPVRDLKILNQELKNAINNLLVAKRDSDEWNNAITALSKAYIKVADAQKIINQAIGQIVSEFGKLQSYSSRLVTEFMNLGRRGAALTEAFDMRDTLDAQHSWLEGMIAGTENTEDRLELEKQLQAVIEQQISARETLRDIGIGGQSQEIIDFLEEQMSIQRNIIRATQDTVEEVQNELLPLEQTKTKTEEILQRFVGWTPAIRDATTQLNQMDVILGGVLKKANNITFKATTITPQVDTTSLEKANQLAQETKANLDNWQLPLNQIKMNTSQLTNNFSSAKMAAQALAGDLATIAISIGGTVKPVETLDNKLQRVQDSLGDSGTAMQILRGGAEKIVVFANEAVNEGFKLWEKYTKGSADDFAAITDNLDDTVTSAEMVNKILSSSSTPVKEIAQNSENVQYSLMNWISPIQDSENSLSRVANNVQDVKYWVDRVMWSLDEMARKIKGMPKLEIGGAGGGISNMDILTNPEWQ